MVFKVEVGVLDVSGKGVGLTIEVRTSLVDISVGTRLVNDCGSVVGIGEYGCDSSEVSDDVKLGETVEVTDSSLFGSDDGADEVTLLSKDVRDGVTSSVELLEVVAGVSNSVGSDAGAADVGTEEIADVKLGTSVLELSNVLSAFTSVDSLTTDGETKEVVALKAELTEEDGSSVDFVSDATTSAVAPLLAVLDSFGDKEDGTIRLGLTKVLES